jgi:hypothetical protein
MVRRGISERIAMEISGHRTRSVFDRYDYDIVSEADIHEARIRMNQGHRVRPGPSLDATREWHEGSFSAALLVPSEHSEREMTNEEDLTS